MLHVGILLSLVPLVFWGAGDYVAAKLSRKMSSLEINFVYVTYSLIPPTVICIFFGFPNVSAFVFAKFLLMSSIITAGFLCMVKGFSKGAIGLIAPLANAYAIVTLLVSVVFLGVKFSAHQIPAILIVVAGVAVVSYQKSKYKDKTAAYSVIYGLLAMIFFGIGFALMAKINIFEWYQNQLMLGVTSLLVGVIIMFVYERKHPFRAMIRSSKSKLGIAGSLIATTGTLGLFAAISISDNVILTATIASAAPLITALLAYKFDHEHLNIRQRIGTIMVVGGVILLNILV